MKKQDHLYEFVKSLNKNEISFFKKYTQFYSKGSKTPFYLLIFNEMLKSNEYDETATKKKLGSKGFAVHKNQLFEKLLFAMNEMYAQNSSINKQLAYVNSASLAAQKQLYALSEYLISKAEKIQDEFSVTPPLFTQHFRMMLLKSPYYETVDLEILESNYEKTMAAAEAYTKHHELNYLVCLLLYVMQNKEKEEVKEALEKIEMHPIYTGETPLKSPTDKTILYKLKGKIAEYKKDREQAFFYMQKDLEIMASIRSLVQLNPMNYFVALHNVIQYAIQLEKWEEAKSYLPRFKEIIKEYGIKETISLTVSIHSYSLPLEAELLASVSPSEITEGKIMAILEQMKILEQSDANVALSFRILFHLAIAYMKLGHFDKALSLLNDFEYENRKTKVHKEFTYMAEILRMVCAWELELIDVLTSRVRSLSRRAIPEHFQNWTPLFKQLSKAARPEDVFFYGYKNVTITAHSEPAFHKYMKFWVSQNLNR